MAFYDPNDDAFDPSTYASQQPSLLPRARKQSAGGALSQKNADAAFERYMELAGAKDDYSQAQMQALTRSEQANMDDRLAIAAQYAGPKFAGMQESYLKRAMAGREPTRVGNVTIGPDGTITRDIGADRMKQAELQLRLGEKYAQDANRDEQRADRDYQIGLNEDERAYRHARDAAAYATALKPKPGTWVVRTDPNTGEEYLYSSATGERKVEPSSSDVLVAKEPTVPSPGFILPRNLPKLTESQSKAFGQASGLFSVLPNMKDVLSNGYVPNMNDFIAAGPSMGGLPGMAGIVYPRSQSSEQGRLFLTAARKALQYVLRGQSGGTITDDEWEEYGPTWLPWPGESKEDSNRKMQHLEKTMNDLAVQSGPMYRHWGGPAKGTNDQAPKGFPQVTWNGMTQAERNEFLAAGAVTK